jgi:hypothetical protein
VGFNIAFSVHDDLYRPMPDFEKIASFELIHYVVNYDVKKPEAFANIKDFPDNG